MPTLAHFLSKFDREERTSLTLLIDRIISLNWQGLNIKKLQGYEDIFRLRKGRVRIIFSKSQKIVRIIDIDHRNENTYKF